MSFKDTLNETRELLRKSNRANLAHAYLRAEERISDLEAQIIKWKGFLKEIEDAGDESKWIDQNSANLVKEIHERSYKEWLK